MKVRPLSQLTIVTRIKQGKKAKQGSILGWRCWSSFPLEIRRHFVQQLTAGAMGTLGRWGGDLRAPSTTLVVLKLECVPESPRGLVKTQITRPHLQNF